MNAKITMPSLVTLLALRSGDTKKQCEDFLRELFNLIVETVTDGESIKIRELGTFKVIEVGERKSVNVNTGEDIKIPSHKKVVFVPSKELADEVNSPFAMFDSVEIDDSVDIADGGDELADSNGDIAENSVDIARNDDNQSPYETDDSEGTADTTEVSGTPAAGSRAEEVPVDGTIVQEYELPEESEDVSVSNDFITPDEETSRSTGTSDEEQDTLLEEEEKKSYRFITGFACGAACAALICVASYFIWIAPLKSEDQTKSKTATELVAKEQREASAATESAKLDISEKEDAAPADTGKISHQKENSPESAEGDFAPTTPSDEKVYDTITKTRYLTTMAKAHYGNYNLWPYIYEENKSFLGHPDRIKPGTRVVIPTLSKYGVNPSNPEDIKKAKQKGVEIYARFN